MYDTERNEYLSVITLQELTINDKIADITTPSANGVSFTFNSVSEVAVVKYNNTNFLNTSTLPYNIPVVVTFDIQDDTDLVLFTR